VKLWSTHLWNSSTARTEASTTDYLWCFFLPSSSTQQPKYSLATSQPMKSLENVSTGFIRKLMLTKFLIANRLSKLCSEECGKFHFSKSLCFLCLQFSLHWINIVEFSKSATFQKGITQARTKKEKDYINFQRTKTNKNGMNEKKDTKHNDINL
jgi:hypothetical protein